jgi:hypothetical protein
MNKFDGRKDDRPIRLCSRASTPPSKAGSRDHIVGNLAMLGDRLVPQPIRAPCR